MVDVVRTLLDFRLVVHHKLPRALQQRVYILVLWCALRGTETTSRVSAFHHQAQRRGHLPSDMHARNPTPPLPHPTFPYTTSSPPRLKLRPREPRQPFTNLPAPACAPTTMLLPQPTHVPQVCRPVCTRVLHMLRHVLPQPLPKSGISAHSTAGSSRRSMFSSSVTRALRRPAAKRECW